MRRKESRQLRTLHRAAIYAASTIEAEFPTEAAEIRSSASWVRSSGRGDQRAFEMLRATVKSVSISHAARFGFLPGPLIELAAAVHQEAGIPARV